MNEVVTNLLQSYSENRPLRLLIQALPMGGIVDGELAQFYTKEKARRLKVFFEELAQDEIHLSDEIVLNNDFLHKYFVTLKAAIDTKRDEKIQYFARLLRNQRSPLLNPDTDSYEDFIQVLDDLTYQEISILLFIREFTNNHPGPKGLNNMAVYRPMKKKLAEIMSVSENEIVSYFVRLERTGLVHHYKGGAFNKEVHDYLILTDLFSKLETLAGM